ncbi:hypothetical protein R6U77_06180 [Lysinibacillus louembei]|uniref:DUF4367 domain-containing protein n=1 Tax=Lysinibacillus louembei TaxID=1470088 RepID=A0ABZ0S1C0_9BACI|nr:hypothetical protein [Lysinibacillus louembei]WPK13261.1 hypothetical protein R6U77_06180 [Lysinibacillus louembei]
MFKIKKIGLFLFSICLLFIFLINSSFANEYKFEKNLLDIGYKEIDKAIAEAETYFQRTIKLPKKVPGLEFTHIFGRFISLDATPNTYLEIKYINQDSPEKHYKIEIRPIKHKIPINDTHITQLLKLHDGSDVIYSTKIQGFNILIFEKNEWQYILSLDQRVSQQAAELLLKIANSVE